MTLYGTLRNLSICNRMPVPLPSWEELSTQARDQITSLLEHKTTVTLDDYVAVAPYVGITTEGATLQELVATTIANEAIAIASAVRQLSFTLPNADMSDAIFITQYGRLRNIQHHMFIPPLSQLSEGIYSLYKKRYMTVYLTLALHNPDQIALIRAKPAEGGSLTFHRLEKKHR